jgi:uncharacterized protein YggE
MTDAQNKAEQLTTLAGAELGDVLTISDFSAIPLPVGGVVQEETANVVPVLPGTELVQANIQVTWEIR